ncbi:MAG: cytochrome ubiquinol oxidase subunit I [Phycisphaerae bacterium]|nr:cytochrome ubiquinol oxidase subunit I [Phycisphaerae bacterium]
MDAFFNAFSDALFLSRLQFAMTVMFHYLFPPLTIGLGVLLVVLEGMYLKTKNIQYEAAARFWTRIFALNFAMGVVTGITMEFQFGTNWSTYSRTVGDVFGAALAAEGIFAFFLESGFLAVLVFGWDRVGPKMHFFATCMVALGAIFSSIWIIVANSWQQTPRGHHLMPQVVNGVIRLRAETDNFLQVVFNYSTIHRLLHVWIGALMVGAFFVMSVTAWYLLKGRHQEFAKKSFGAALVVGALASLGALIQGDLQAKNVYQHQPAKMAAFEGHYQTGRGDLYLFGIPSDRDQRVRSGIAMPGGLSFLLFHNFNQEVKGLDKFPVDERPPVPIPFYSFHIMVALGMFMIALTCVSLVLWWRNKLFDKRWLLWIFVFAVAAPYIANQLGWVAAEVGRQPWIVQGVLKTSEACSPTVSAAAVRSSIIGFGLIYTLLFILFIYLLNAQIRRGPEIPAHAADAAARPKHGFLDTAAHFADRGGESLTDIRGDSKTSDRGNKSQDGNHNDSSDSSTQNRG